MSGKPFRGFESHPLRQLDKWGSRNDERGITDNASFIVQHSWFIVSFDDYDQAKAFRCSDRNARNCRRDESFHLERPVPASAIAHNPLVPCKTSATFQPYDLPFRVPKSAVIFDTELFYAIVLQSVGAGETDCDVVVPESERLAAQALFTDHKVFTSRCPDVETLLYTSVSPKHRFMAVYAGATLVGAKHLLDAVKATGKFPGAYIRRMRTGFNGT